MGSLPDLNLPLRNKPGRGSYTHKLSKTTYVDYSWWVKEVGSYEYLLVCAGLDTELQVYYHKIGMYAI